MGLQPDKNSLLEEAIMKSIFAVFTVEFYCVLELLDDYNENQC